MQDLHFPDGHQPFRRLSGNGIQDRLVGNAEDGRVATDPERQDEHGHHGGAGVLKQLAQGVFEIVRHGCQWSVVSRQSKVKTLVANSQSPMPKLQRKPNAQIPTGCSAARLIGTWELALPWDLVIGHWSLVIPFMALLWDLDLGHWNSESLWCLELSFASQRLHWIRLSGFDFGDNACGARW